MKPGVYYEPWDNMLVVVCHTRDGVLCLLTEYGLVLYTEWYKLMRPFVWIGEY